MMRHAIQNSNFLYLNAIVLIIQFWHSAAGHGQHRQQNVTVAPNGFLGSVPTIF